MISTKLVNNNNMPFFIVLTGVPAAGKSTLRAAIFPETFVISSSDDFIDARAKELGMTYSEIFQDTIKESQAHAFSKIQQAVMTSQSVVIDQTNLTTKSRRAKLQQIPRQFQYRKVCINVVTVMQEQDYQSIPIARKNYAVDADYLARLGGRPGKEIPMRVVNHFKDTYQTPELSEGFDEIYITTLSMLPEIISRESKDGHYEFAKTLSI